MEKKYSVAFGCNADSDLQDETQTVLIRLIAKDHPILYGEQSHFDAYLRVAAKNVAKDVPMWEKRKGGDVWESQDTLPSKNISKTNFAELFTSLNSKTKPILNKAEQEYLKLYLNSNETNETICAEMWIKEKRGEYLKKNIVSKLKAWTKKDNTLADAMWSDVDKRSKLTSKDLSDLRYRVIPMSQSERNENDEKVVNSTMPVKNIEIKADYCPLKRRYSGKITAPVAPIPAKISTHKAWWDIPAYSLDQDYDVDGIEPDVTVGHMMG